MLILCTVLIISFSFGEQKIADIHESFRSIVMCADENNIYIADKAECVVHIYSRINFRHLAQFGRKGQGPGDFEFIDFLLAFPDFVFVSSGMKVSYFSKNGKFLRDVTPPYISTGGYILLGKYFAGERYLPEDPRKMQLSVVVELFDSKFNKKKELYVAELNKTESYDFESGKKNLLVMDPCFKLAICEDKLFIGNTEVGFFFRVFDKLGQWLYDINLPFKKHYITSSDQKRIIGNIRKHVGDQRVDEAMAKVRFIFPKEYPAYSDFAVDDGKLYVFSYPKPDDPIEIIILDLLGNFKKKVVLPMTQEEIKGEQPYCIYRGKLYYMKFNEVTYNWELYYHSIE
jgi:hypothetical protein